MINEPWYLPEEHDGLAALVKNELHKDPIPLFWRCGFGGGMAAMCHP